MGRPKSILDSGMFGECEWRIVRIDDDDCCRLVIRPGKQGGHLPPTGGEPFIFSCPWVEYQRIATSLVVEEGVIADADSTYLFADLHSCKTMDLTALDTSNVINFAHILHGCRSLRRVNLAFDTSQAVDVSYMFCDCRELEWVYLPDSFVTEKAVSMTRMFYGCKNMETLRVPDGFTSGNVSKMRYMFFGCEKLDDLALPDGFTAANASDVMGMFANCKSLSSSPIPYGFAIRKGADTDKMFWGCSSLDTDELPAAVTYVLDEDDLFGCLI